MQCKIDSKALLLWQIRLAAIFVIFEIAFFILTRYTVWLYLPIAVFAVIYAVCAIWYIPAFFKSYLITVTDEAIIITRGVIVKTTHIMPFLKLVFAQSYSSPLASLMGLSTVTLKAARAALMIPEISNENAKKLIYGISGGEKGER